MNKQRMVIKGLATVVLIALLVWPVAGVLAGTFGPVTVTDQTPTAPLSNPAPASYQPRYISGFGSDNTFTVFFEDRDAAGQISYVSTTSGPTGFPAGVTATNIADTHFVVKDWPINVDSTDYAYRAWGSVGNNMEHKFYVSNDLTNWTLVSTFTILNAASFTDAQGWVYYGFHDVILLNGTYYAFAESNQSQTMLVRSANGDDVWEAFASIGGHPGWGPLELPSGVVNGWTPSGSFVDLGHDRGYGKVYVDPRDSAFYLAVNTAAKASLSPANLEAAFIDPANWTWHDGTTGPAANAILSETAEHDLRECWVVPNSDPDGDWVIVYDADFGSADGGKALGYATLSPPLPPPDDVWVDDDWASQSDVDAFDTSLTWQYDAFASLQDGVDAVAESGTVNVRDGTYGVTAQTNQDGYSTAILIKGKDDLTIQAAAGHQPVVRPVTAVEANIVSVSIEDCDGLTVDNIDSDQTTAQFDNWHVFDSNDLTVRNSRFEGGEDGIDFNTSLTTALIENNVFVDINTGSGDEVLDFTDASYSDIVIQDNVFQNNYRHITINPPSGQLATDFTIRRNYMDGTTSQEGVRFNDGGGTVSAVVLENNVIMHSLQQGLYVKPPVSDITVRHNTFFQNTEEEIRLREAAGDVLLKNNIIYANGTHAAISARAPFPPGPLAGEDYNLIYNNGPATESGSALPITVFGANTITGSDPLFVSTAAGSEDLHLQPDSPAQNEGTDLGVSDDIEKNARPDPVGSNPDMGAYERGVPPTGQLQVVKVLDPASDPGKFNLQIDSTTDPDAADVGDGGDTGKETVTPGDHTVGETAGTGTTLDDYDTTIVCKDGGGSGGTVASSSDAGPLTVNVATDDDIVCTITNTRKGAPNLIQNPGFEEGTDPWLFYSNVPAGFSIGQPGSGSDNAARVEVNGWGSNVQLFQDSIALKPNTAYRLSFDAKSNTGHDLHVSLLKHGPPYINYGLSQVPFDLDTDWQPFSHEFTTAGFSQPVNDGRLRFWFPIGAQPGDVYWIDNVVLEEIVIGPTTSLEVLKDVQPDDASQWLIDVAGTSFFTDTLTGDDSTGPRHVEPDTYTITESGYAGTNLDDYNASYDCSIDGQPGPSGDGPQVTLAIALGQTVRCTFTNANKESRPNLVANPSFELGTTDWHFYTNGQALFTTGAPASSGAAAGLLNVVSPGSNTQLYQPGISLEPYTDYQLCFDAFSNSGYDLAVYLQKHTTPYTSYGLHNELADLDTDWDTFCFWFNTSMLSAPVNDGRLRFSPLGSGLFVIDNIVLEKAAPGPATSLEVIKDVNPDDATEWDIVVAGPSPFNDTLVGDDSTGARSVEPGDYTIDETAVPPTDPNNYDTTYACTINGVPGPSGDGTHIDVAIALDQQVVCTFTNTRIGALPNLIRNPGFEQGTDDWLFYTNGTGGFTASPPGYSDAAAARVGCTSPGNNMQLFQNGIALKPNTNYRLTFVAKATDGHDMWLYLHKDSPPYTNYGLNGALADLDADWDTFTYDFTTSGFAQPVTDGRLRFWFVGGAQAGDVYRIDDVVLQEVPPY